MGKLQRAAVGGPVTAVNGVAANVGAPVAGSYGSLSLNADGSYSYQSTPNSVPAGTTVTDVFQYTITDGDGDTSTTTLTISVNNVTLTASDTDALVNEAGLPVIGSNAASDSEIFNGAITPSGGSGPYTYTLTSRTTDVDGAATPERATSNGAGRPPGARADGEGASGGGGERRGRVARGRIHVLDDQGRPVAYNVGTGVSDGMHTELLVRPGSPAAEALTEGVQVITGMTAPAAAARPTGPRMPF